MVRIYKLAMTTGVTLYDGKYSFLGTLSGKNDKGFTNPDKKYMVFLRGIIKIAGE